MQDKSAEIPILDNLRAAAAWAVCLYHFVCTTTGFIDTNGLTYKIFYQGQYGVHLFFIISGLVIPWSMYHKGYHIRNFFRFLGKRLLRLEPPYVFSMIFVLIIIFLRRYSPTYDGIDRAITIKQILLHFGYMVPFFDGVTWINNVYWTLAIEFQYYLAVGLLYFLFISKRVFLRWLGYAVLLSAPFLPASSDFMPFWLPLFGVGILLFSYKSGIVSIGEWAVVTLMCIVHLWFFNSREASVLAFVAAGLILLCFQRSITWLAVLGRSSYSVYLIHPFLGATFINVFSHYTSGSFAKFMVVLGGVVITAGGSYLMYRLVEKPSKKLSSRLRYK
jgi:peptidoglycan/LPS O-acetylase OafA/YrhL